MAATEGRNDGPGGAIRGPHIAPALAAAAAVLVSFVVYLPALGSFFSNDDWVLLDYYGRINPWRFWEYFSPRTIWFYRPLQSAQFGVFFHLFGLNDTPYNLSLFFMHAGVCALWYLLVRRLARSAWLAAGSTALFAFMWNYVDVLLWKSNFNTLHWALLALATCNAYLVWLDTGTRRWRIAAILLYAGCFFAKEMAVCVPFLLLLLWCERRLPFEDLRARRLRVTTRDAVAEMLPFGLLTVVYIVLHRLLLEDVAKGIQPLYAFAAPPRALVQVLAASSALYLNVFADPLLVAQVPPLRQGAVFLVFTLPVLPLLLAGVALWRRDRVMLFAIGFTVFSAVPTVFLVTYHSSRFNYLPAAGAALVLARLLGAAFAWGGGSGSGLARAGRAAALFALTFFLLSNIAATRLLVERDREQSDRVRELFELLRRNRDEIPPEPVISIRNAPTEFFNAGLGAREMVQHALGDPGAEGVVVGQPMLPDRLERIHANPRLYTADLSTSPLHLVGTRRVADDTASTASR